PGLAREALLGELGMCGPHLLRDGQVPPERGLDRGDLRVSGGGRDGQGGGAHGQYRGRGRSHVTSFAVACEPTTVAHTPPETGRSGPPGMPPTPRASPPIWPRP